MIVVVNGDREITIPNSEITKNMKEFEIDELTSARMWLEDNAFILPENHDRIEAKNSNKKAKKTRMASATEDTKKERPRKVDETKGKILTDIKAVIENLNAESIEMKTETELSFIFKGESYTLKLTKHRKAKA